MEDKKPPKKQKQQKRDRASRFVTQPHEIKYCPETGRILNG